MSILSFFLILINSKNIFLSLMYLLFFFYLPEILLKIYSRKEHTLLIKEIITITNNLNLLLKAKMSLYDSFIVINNSITHKRLKKEFENFIYEYKLYNLDIKKALKNLNQKFNFLEFNSLVNLLIQIDLEGKFEEIIEVYLKNLEISYFKYVKYRKSKMFFVIIVSSIISIINLSLVSIYPIIVELTDSINKILI